MTGDADLLFDGRPRKKRAEDQLTNEIAKLCREDDALRLGFVRALLTAVESHRADSVCGQLPSTGASLEVIPQKNLGRVSLKRLRETGGKPDFVILGSGLLVVVEAKIDADLQPKQLERYLNYVRSCFRDGSATTGGLVLLNDEHRKIGRFLTARNRWLGQLTWSELTAQLEDVKAKDADVDRRWQELLRIVQLPGDLGDGVAPWNRGKLKPNIRNKRILAAAQKGIAATLAASAKGQVTGSAKLHCETTLLTPSRDSAELHLKFPRAKTAAVVIRVWGSNQPLKAAVIVPRPHAARASSANQQAAIADLQAPPFRKTSEGFRADVVFRADGSGDPPSVALRSQVDSLITTIGKSGAINGAIETPFPRTSRRLKIAGRKAAGAARGAVSVRRRN